jgi:WD40 repeat protein
VGHNDAVNVVAWNPQNSMQFVSGSSDRRAVIWDIERLNLNTP